MDKLKLNRLRSDLAKARKRRDEWDARTKDLERRYKEAENTCIHDMVHAANLTPEQLAELIQAAAAGQPYVFPGTAPGENSDEEVLEVTEEEEDVEG